MKENQIEMDLGTAQNIAKQLRNHYRAFEHLDAFVRKTVALEGTLREFESRKAGLQKEVDALTEKKAKLPEMAARHAELTRDIANLEQRKETMSTVESDCTRLEGERVDLETAVNGLKVELAEIKAKMAGSLKKIA